jgi:hypothetical protein
MLKKSEQYALCLFAMVCLVFTNTYSRNYYVATNGNDNDGGTTDRPFATISKAAAVAQAGDSVIIKSGTYIQTTNIKFTNSGIGIYPIVYKAEVAGQAIIDGQSSVPTIASREGLIHVSGKNWLVFDGLRIINSGFFGILMTNTASNITVKNCSTFMTGASGVCGANSSNITVLNNTIQKACIAPSAGTGTNECITMASVEGFEVAYNTVFDRLVDVNNGGEGIDAKNACLNGKIHHNKVYDLIRLGIYVDAYAKNLTNVEVYANTVYNCSSGITVASEEGATVLNVKVYDNIVRDISGVGIRLAGYLNNGPLQDVDVYNNTIVRCGKTRTATAWENCGILVEATNTANRNFNIRNNLISECTNGIRTNGQTYPIIDNNLIFGTTTFSGTNRLSANPLFVNSIANDFRLLRGSPAIDKATGTPVSAVDFAGNIRPLDGDGNGSIIADIGAYEYNPTTGVFGIKEVERVKLYPNPAHNYVILEALKDNAQVELYDVLGKKVLFQQANNTVFNVDISGLSKGVYFVKVMRDNSLIQKGKFVKQ